MQGVKLHKAAQRSAGALEAQSLPELTMAGEQVPLNLAGQSVETAERSGFRNEAKLNSSTYGNNPNNNNSNLDPIKLKNVLT